MRDEVFDQANKLELVETDLTRAMNAFELFEERLFQLRCSLDSRAKNGPDALMPFIVGDIDYVTSTFELAKLHAGEQLQVIKSIKDELFTLCQQNKKNALEAGTSEDAKTQPKG